MNVLITGVNGQDGRIISRHFKSMGDQVFGISRRSVMSPISETNNEEYINISDSEEFSHFLDYVKPNKIFHLAASHANSHKMQEHGEHSESEMYSTHIEATKTILEWQKNNHDRDASKLVVALSSQMFTADYPVTKINEDSPIKPSSKYGLTKSQAFNLIKQYREDYDIFASGAILFNHSSSFSKQDFVLIEIAKQIIKVLRSESNEIKLRDFEAELDISNAEDVCNGMIQMLNLANPQDFVLASGTLTNLKRLTLDCLYYYKVDRKIELISTHPSQGSRNFLLGNPQKASTKLNWIPSRDSLSILVKIVDALKDDPNNV